MTTEQHTPAKHPYYPPQGQGPPAGQQPPPYKPMDSNPYHAGYDQPNATQVSNYPAQPPVIQMQPPSTVVNIQAQPAIVVGQSRGSDLTWPAVFVCLCCCVFTGLPAIVYAIMAQNRYGEGQWAEAEVYQRRARNLIGTSVILHFCTWILFVVLYFVAIKVAIDKADDTFSDLSAITPAPFYDTTLPPY